MYGIRVFNPSRDLDRNSYHGRELVRSIVKELSAIIPCLLDSLEFYKNYQLYTKEYIAIVHLERFMLLLCQFTVGIQFNKPS